MPSTARRRPNGAATIEPHCLGAADPSLRSSPRSRGFCQQTFDYPTNSLILRNICFGYRTEEIPLGGKNATLPGNPFG